jgi:hypothetical protein
MSKSNKKEPTKKYIAIDDLAHDLGLLDSDVISWVAIDHPELTHDHRGRPCISTCFLDKYSQSKQYLRALRNSIASQVDESAARSNQRAQLRKERKDLISSYEDFIKELEDFHRKYMQVANGHGFESAVMAAYLLFGRAINLLNMGCLCLKHGYWYSGSVLRDIDETLDVARYFVLTNGTAQGETARHRWFRQNLTPKHAVCRSKIANWQASLGSGPGEDNFRELMNELYRKKSKWTHPTFGVIREVTAFEIGGDDHIRVANMEYRSSSLEHKLHELSIFFRSSVFTAFQVFLLCFKQAMPLEDQDTNYLLTRVRMFQELDNSGL